MNNVAKLIKDTRAEAALVLSAGAPQAPLIAGALYGLYREGIRFRRIYASGGGALIALLLVAPMKKRGRNPTIAERLAALKSITELGVDDAIFDILPIGYKTFFKPGPFTEPFRNWAKLLKLGSRSDGGRLPNLDKLKERYEKEVLHASLEAKDREAFKRLYNDWIDLLTGVITPGVLTPESLGLCAPFPLADDVVDFALLDRWAGTLSVPAYDLNPDPNTGRQRGIVQFSNRPGPGAKKLDANGVRACLAAPFIYPPFGLGGGLYTEGAFEEPYNEDTGWLRDVEEGKIRSVLILDILNREDELLREPLDLWDAYGSSIMTPVVAQAKTVRRLFALLKEENAERRSLLDWKAKWLDKEKRQLRAEKRKPGKQPKSLSSREERLRKAEEQLKKEAKRVTLSDVHWMPRFTFPGGSRNSARPTSNGNAARRRYLADWSRGTLDQLFERGVKAAEAYLTRPLSKPDPRADSAAELLRRRSPIDAAIAEGEIRGQNRDLLPTYFRNEYARRR